MGTLVPTRFNRHWLGGARGLPLAGALALALACSCKKEEAPRPEPAGSQAAGSQAGKPGEWSLARAATPYKGVTLHAIGESLPPLEAMAKLATTFEEQTGIK